MGVFDATSLARLATLTGPRVSGKYTSLCFSGDGTVSGRGWGQAGTCLKQTAFTSTSATVLPALPDLCFPAYTRAEKTQSRQGHRVVPTLCRCFHDMQIWHIYISPLGGGGFNMCLCPAGVILYPAGVVCTLVALTHARHLQSTQHLKNQLLTKPREWLNTCIHK